MNLGTMAFVILVVIGVGASGIYFVTTGKTPFNIASGMAPLSLSQASFQSSNPFFNEKLWILTVAQGGIGAQAIGTIDNSDIGTKTGQTPAQDINLAITYSTQACEYPISTSGNLNLQISSPPGERVMIGDSAPPNSRMDGPSRIGTRNRALPPALVAL